MKELSKIEKYLFNNWRLNRYIEKTGITLHIELPEYTEAELYEFMDEYINGKTEIE